MQAGRLKRIRKELADKDKLHSPYRFPNGCYAEPRGDDLRKWKGLIIGPKGTCYENGYFHLDITFPVDYPFKPMKILFETKIYHPQIQCSGQICLAKGFLRYAWTPAWKLSKILHDIQEMLKDPDPEYPFDPNQAALLVQNPKLYDKTAREWVLKHAPPPKQPVIENMKYEYCISGQHVLCTFNVSFAHCELQKSEKFRLVIQTENELETTEQSITREQMEYSVILPVTMDYGTTKCIESMLLMDDTDEQTSSILPYTSQWHYLYLDALTDQEYVLLITGVWRECSPETDINTDLVGICHRFYDHPFDLTMRWWITQSSTSFIEERTIRLTDAQEINCGNWSHPQVTEWIRKTFLNAFRMRQVMDDFTIWKSSSNISIGKPFNFKVLSYPKTIDIFMDFSRIKCFDAEYEGHRQRIVFLSGNHLSFVKYRVKTQLGIADDVHVDRINLYVDDRVINAEDEMEKYLLLDQSITVCHVSVS